MADTSTVAKQFPLLNRTIKGIQNLTDGYSADGEENQKKFVTDLNTVIDTIKDNSSDIDKEDITYDPTSPDLTNFYNAGQVDDLLGNLPTQTWDVQSVTSLPASPAANTIYLIQGTVVVQ